MRPKVDYVMDCTACAQPQRLISGQVKIMKHPILRVAVCRECIEFAHSDVVPLDDEGYEIYCKWCMEVGLLVFCDKCKTAFCKDCIIRNFDENHYNGIVEQEIWSCYICDPTPLTTNRGLLEDAFLYQHTGEATKTFIENCQKKFEGLQTTQSDREAIIKERIKLRHKTVLGDLLDSADSNDLQLEESEEEEEKLKKKKKIKKRHIQSSTDSNKGSTMTKTLKEKYRKTSKKIKKQHTSKTDGFILKKKKISDKKDESKKSNENADSSSSGIELLDGEKSSEETHKENLKNSGNLKNKETVKNEISKKVIEPTSSANSALWDDDLTIEENLPDIDLGVMKSAFSSEGSDEEELLKELKQKRKIKSKAKTKSKKKSRKMKNKKTDKDKEEDKKSEKKDEDVLSESDEYVSLSEDDTPIDQRKTSTA